MSTFCIASTVAEKKVNLKSHDRGEWNIILKHMLISHKTNFIASYRKYYRERTHVITYVMLFIRDNIYGDGVQKM